jgi:hypothetical protein
MAGIRYLFIFIIIVLSSCSSSRKHYSFESSFTSSDLKKVNGKYCIDRVDLYEFFNIKAKDYIVQSTNKYYGTYETSGDIVDAVAIEENLSKDSVGLDFIILKFNGLDSLSIMYRDYDFWYKKTYKGKLKENYFEITLQNKRYPFFPIISRHDVDRIKIGLSQLGEVLVHNYNEHWGTFLLFGAHTGGDEYSISLKRME